MRWAVVVGCLVLAACSGGGSEGSPTTTTGTTAPSATTEPPPAEKGTLDGVEVSSGHSAFVAHHLDTTYLVDAGRIGATFAPTLRAFVDDGTVRTYAMPIEDPLVYVFPFWADGGLSVFGIDCPGWTEGEVPEIDLNEPGEVQRVCGSAELALRRWTEAGWEEPRAIFDAPSGYGFRSVHGAEAVLSRVVGNEEAEGLAEDPVLVDLLTGEVDELPAVPEGMREICLQSDGPVVIVDPGSSEDGVIDAAGRWTAQRLDGTRWGTPVELPEAFVAGCLGDGGFLVDARTGGLWVEVEPGGTLRTQDLGKPPPASVQFHTTLGIIAEGYNRLFVFTAGVWVDAGPEPDAHYFPAGAKVVVQPRGETADEEGTIVRLTPVTLRLQG